MADDTVNAARQAILTDWYTGDFTQEQLRERLDALIAAVRAEHGLTVVKLRDDETWPIASACAIAGACQWGR